MPLTPPPAEPETSAPPCPIRFEARAEDPGSAARCGRLTTPHGSLETPEFMPVGTQATVKGLTPDLLRQVGSRMVLANTYHLALRPGEAVVEGFLEEVGGAIDVLHAGKSVGDGQAAP